MPAKISKLNKNFGDFQALCDIDLEIKDGEFVAVVGPSGCGKTTLLRLIAGFEKPTSGTITIDGKKVSDEKGTLPPEKRNIGMVFQNFALWPHMNVREHIEFPLLYHGFIPDEIKKFPQKRVDEVLRITGMEKLGKRFPGQLSGGQKQRVALGRAIAPEPGLLLMDEPLSSLDAELRMEMRREIQKLHINTGSSILYVTHDQGEALAMADRIVVMKGGRIEQTGTPDEIYYKPETEFVAGFVSRANLIRGEWNKDTFTPYKTGITWQDEGTSERIREKGLYLLRPEDIILTSPESHTLNGTVMTRQFQGKEYQYSVETENNGTIMVNTGIKEVFTPGDKVAVSLRMR